MKRLLVLAVTTFLCSSPVYAYVDGSPTLGSVIRDSSNIVVLEVTRVNVEKRVIIYKKVADLKGKHPTEDVKHVITNGFHAREPKFIMDWAEPGKTAVCFQLGRTCLTCIGGFWYECAAGDASWWTMTTGRPGAKNSCSGGRGDRTRATNSLTSFMSPPPAYSGPPAPPAAPPPCPRARCR